MRKIFLLAVIFTLLSFTNTSLKKRISDADFRYEFYTTDKKVTALPNREYFWFKGGAIHNTEYGIGGELLQDEFLKFYHNNQLAEAGAYEKGLKKGYWKAWFKNGVLQSKIYWQEGQMDGSYFLYNSTGELVEEGKYKNNKKHGRWINYITKDTLKYRNGQIIVKKVKDTTSAAKDKPGFFKRLFGKKSNDSIVAVKQQMVKDKTDTKQGFFKRVFSKKNKTKKEEAGQVRDKGNDKKRKKNKTATDGKGA